MMEEPRRQVRREVSWMSVIGIVLATALISGGVMALLLARPSIICPDGWLPVFGPEKSFCAKDGSQGYIP